MKNKKSLILCVAVCLLSVIFSACGYFLHYRYADSQTFSTKTYVCYITPTGECYHASSCRYANLSMETTVFEAKQQGYRACSYCKDKVEKGTKNERWITYHDPNVPYPSVGWYILAPIVISVFAFVIYKKRAGVEPA